MKAGGRSAVSRLGTAVAVVLLLSACGAADDAGDAAGSEVPEEERYGGTAVIGGSGAIPTLDPLTSRDYLANQLARYALFTPLVRFDPGMEPRPWLAASWELNGDSTEVVFHLRDDVRWHDGEPVTAADVAFTFRAVKNPDVAYPNGGLFARWDSVDVVDSHTVSFRLRPFAGFLFAWHVTPVLPEHVLGDVPPAEFASDGFGVRSLVGSGPYRFAGHLEGDRWMFEANPDFPEALGGRPYLDRLVYRNVPDETTLLAELRAGEVDFYMKVLPSQIERIRRAPDLRFRTLWFPGYGFIGWNTRRPQFADPTVRRALTMAIDRRQIVEAALNGLGRPATGPVGPWHWAYDSAWTPLPHAPDSSRALLAGAGWVDGDGDGVREKDGRELSFRVVTNDTRQRRDVAILVQSNLRAVGVEATPRVREYASLVQAVTGPERDFDAVVLSFQPDLVVDDRDLWACDRRDEPFQFTGYCDPGVDSVMNALPTTLDRDRRRRLVRRYNEMIYRDQPMSFLYFEERADGLRRELRGVEMNAHGELVSVADWWLTPGGR